MSPQPRRASRCTTCKGSRKQIHKMKTRNLTPNRPYENSRSCNYEGCKLVLRECCSSNNIGKINWKPYTNFQWNQESRRTSSANLISMVVRGRAWPSTATKWAVTLAGKPAPSKTPCMEYIQMVGTKPDNRSFLIPVIKVVFRWVT